MKHIKIFEAFIIVVLFLSCGRQAHIDETFRWPSSGIDTADSILIAYERVGAWLPAYRELNRHDLTQKMCSLAVKNPENRMLQLRAAYMKLNLRHPFAQEHIANELSEIVTIQDSLKFPYDFHVINGLLAEQENNTYQKYILLTENVRFFSKCGSEFEVARNTSRIGSIFWLMHDTAMSQKYYEQSISIYEKLGLKSYWAESQMKKSNVENQEESRSTLRELLKSDSADISPLVMAGIYHNAAVAMDSIELIRKSLEIQKQFEDMKRIPASLSYYGLLLSKKGCHEEGLGMIRETMANIKEYGTENRFMPAIHNIAGKVYQANGMKDSAMSEFDKAFWSAVEYRQQYTNTDIYALDAMYRIEMIEKTTYLEKFRIIMCWVVSLLTLGLIIIYMYMKSKRRQEQRLHEKELFEEKLESERKSKLAQLRIMEESEKLIAEFDELINRLKTRNLIKEDGAEEISRILKIYKSNEDNRQGFLRISQELDSRFVSKLKTEYPNLSEYRLRLAALIASGVDSRQIAHILNTSQESVYKSRYRLRTQLGLSRNDSLEDFLRKFNQRSHLN